MSKNIDKYKKYIEKKLEFLKVFERFLKKSDKTFLKNIQRKFLQK